MNGLIVFNNDKNPHNVVRQNRCKLKFNANIPIVDECTLPNTYTQVANMLYIYIKIKTKLRYRLAVLSWAFHNIDN